MPAPFSRKRVPIFAVFGLVLVAALVPVYRFALSLALFHAVDAGDLTVVVTLVRLGAPVDALDAQRKTPLVHALELQRAAMVRALLKAGASPDGDPSLPGMPAITAVSKDDPAALWMLIRAGAHLQVPLASSGLLVGAVSQGDPELIAAIMAGGVRPDKLQGRYPLLEMAAGVVPADRAPADGRPRPRTTAELVSAVRLLLDAHADLEMTPSGGTTALTAAIVAGNYEVAELLLSRGARVDNRGTSSLDACGAALIGGDVRFGSLLFRSPGISKLRPELRLCFAAWNGDLGETNRLLVSGIDPNPRDSSQPSALLLAAREGHTPIVRTLLTHGADPEGRAATAFAELRRGGSPNPPEHTPLAAATRAGKLETVRVLREHGARYDGR